MGDPPFRPVTFGPMDIDVAIAPDGSQRVRPRASLPPVSASLCDILSERALAHPDRGFLAQRGADSNWVYATYREIKQQSDAIAQSLIDRQLGRDCTVLILSHNSIEFAEMVMGCLAARVPVTPVSPAYSLMSNDFAVLKHIADLVEPALIFVQDDATYAAAIAALRHENIEVVSAAPSTTGATPLTELNQQSATEAVTSSIANIDPEAPAEISLHIGLNRRTQRCDQYPSHDVCQPDLLHRHFEGTHRTADDIGQFDRALHGADFVARDINPPTSKCVAIFNHVSPERTNIGDSDLLQGEISRECHGISSLA